MAYDKVHEPWQAGQAGGTAITPTALNTMEEGIEEAHNLAAAAQATADAATSQQLPFVRLDTVNQKGDVIVGASFGVVTRVGVGGTNQVLIPDASTPSGLAWANIDLSRLSGFPSNASLFARGDGTWAAPSGGVPPTHLPPTTFLVSRFGNATTANTAYLSPIAGVIATTTITRLGFWFDSGAGSYDIGIYFSDDEATFTRHVSLGSTAVPSGGTRLATVASTVVTPVAGRRWYYGFASSQALQLGATVAPPGSYSKASSFPLPASLNSMTAGTTAESFPIIQGMV